MAKDRTTLDWLLLPYDLFLGYAGVVFVLLLAFGPPLVVFTFMWLVILRFVQLGIGYPVVTIGVFAALDLPATVYGVPLLYAVVPGALTTLFLSRGWVSKADEA